MNARALAAVLTVVALAMAHAAARAGTDPDRRWSTIVTPHFAVHFYDDGGAEGSRPTERPSLALARTVADLCEEARVAVGAVLDWHPRERVHVAVVDDFDAANGFAGVVPYPLMTLWAWPPPPDSELGNHADWLRLLVVHEYTHIVHLDTSGGIPEGFNTIFGRLWKPNNATPRWLTEGIAVWLESRTGVAAGRIGSSGTEAYFRTSALADRLPALGDLTGSPLEEPRGSMWYLYGGALFDHIARHAGDDAVRRFARDYGTWAAPFALNALARRATGKTFVAWFDELLADVRARAAATAERVRAEGLREGVVIRGVDPDDVDSLDAPRFAPDGELLWTESDGNAPTRLVAARPVLGADGITVTMPAPRHLLRCEGGCGRFAATRDGTRVLIATGRDHRLSSYQSHLALAPLPTPAEGASPRRAPRLLEASRRAYDPTPAADGRSAWAVRTRWSRPELARYDLDSGELVQVIALPATLAAPRVHPRLDRPAASADGKALYLSMHDGANRDLYRVDLADGSFHALTHGAADELDVVLSADERWLLYASDRTGVMNVYARELATGTTRQLTNTLTAATSPALSPDGRLLVYRAWTVDGPTLAALPFTPEAAPLVPDDDTPPRPPAASPPVAPKGEVPYHPLPTMLPRSWLPTVTAGSNGPAFIGLAFEAIDPTSRYALTLSADWDLDRADWSAFASFALRTGYPDLGFQLGRYSWDRTSFVGDVVEPYTEEVVYAGASVALPFPDVFAGLTWGFGVNADIARGLDVGELRHTPDETMAFIPEERFRTSLNMFTSFSDVRQHALAIAPSEGVSGTFNVSVREPALGGDGRAFTFTFVSRAHIPLGAFGHVLALRLGGGLTAGDPSARAVFTLGGVPRQDLLSDLLNQTAAGAVWLRGFDEGAFQGWRFGLLTGEWRFPLARIRSGVGTLPVFFEDLSAAVFSDAGGVTFGKGLGDALVAGVGAELRLRMELWYGVLYDFRLGYAHGFGEHGGDQVYFLMAGAP